MIFPVAAIFAAIPAAAQSSPPVVPPLPVAQSSSVYAMHGQLSGYVPATMYADGRISVHVDAARPSVPDAIGKTVVFRIPAQVRMVPLVARIRYTPGVTGTVRFVSLRSLTYAQLGTPAAMSVTIDSGGDAVFDQ